MPDAPFWKTKTFDEMTRAEWESLCDGCAKCCLNKLQDEDTGEYHFTDVACRLLDLNTCRCTHYAARQAIVPECQALTPENVGALDWLPSTCAYRLVYEGEDLADWHPLVSGDAESVHRAGVSVRGRVKSESDIADLENHIVAWPA
ncbi:MAG: YcgN family cysteine cluster protein [Rhodospirillales bacterium]